jgi:hypothetical protein
MAAGISKKTGAALNGSGYFGSIGFGIDTD